MIDSLREENQTLRVSTKEFIQGHFFKGHNLISKDSHRMNVMPQYMKQNSINFLRNVIH